MRYLLTWEKHESRPLISFRLFSRVFTLGNYSKSVQYRQLFEAEDDLGAVEFSHEVIKAEKMDQGRFRLYREFDNKQLSLMRVQQ